MSRYRSYNEPLFLRAHRLPKAEEWFEAARNGDEKSIAEILNESTGYLREKEIVSQHTAFHIAVENGRRNVVAQLLAVDPNFIDAVDSEGQIALHIAATRGYREVLELLLAAKPSSVTKTIEGSGQTALHCAARRGRKKIVDILLAVCPALIDVDAFEGRTVLHEAACNKHSNTIVARLLAEKPSLIEATDEKGNLALHFAALAGCSQTVAVLLAALPGSANTANKSLHIPLHFAATHWSEKLITQLLKANPEGAFALDKEKTTPFQIAVYCHNSVLVDMQQHHFSYDELTQMFKKDTKEAWVDRLQRLQRELVALCEPALRDSLYPDLVNLVYEYTFGLATSTGDNNNIDKQFEKVDKHHRKVTKHDTHITLHADDDSSDFELDIDIGRSFGIDIGSSSDSDTGGAMDWGFDMRACFFRAGLAQGSIDSSPPKPKRERITRTTRPGGRRTRVHDEEYV